MKVSEQIAIMKAYEDGKTIEVKHYGETAWETEWEIIVYVEDYPFDFVLNEYRIATKPKYRPYKSVEEAFNEAEKHGFWVREKDRKYMSIICRLSTKVIRVNNLDTTKEVVYINGDSSDYLLKNFVWADDNSPCGIKIE